jgi:hypothetical protein
MVSILKNYTHTTMRSTATHTTACGYPQILVSIFIISERNSSYQPRA